jgi:hypothetical protein
MTMMKQAIDKAFNQGAICITADIWNGIQIQYMEEAFYDRTSIYHEAPFNKKYKTLYYYDEDGIKHYCLKEIENDQEG